VKLVTLKLFVTAILWGGTFIAGRILAPEIDPFSGAFLRFTAALAVLVPYALMTGNLVPRNLHGLDARMILLILALGATGIFGYNVLFLWGLKTVPAGRAAIIVSGNPALVVLFSRMFFKEPLHGTKIAGVILCLTGAAVVVGRGDPLALFSGEVTLHDAAIAGATLTWVAYSLLGKLAMGRISPLAAVTLSCMAGALMLLPPAIQEGLPQQMARLSPRGWSAIAFLGVFGTALGFVWFYEGIRKLGASKAAVFVNFVPVCAAALGVWLLGESVEASMLAGGTLVLMGVALTNKGRIRGLPKGQTMV
jgi:drug/metabolite transporter (DMT)-like permease